MVFTAIFAACTTVVLLVWLHQLLSLRRVRTDLRENAEALSSRAQLLKEQMDDGRIEAFMDDRDGRLQTLKAQRPWLQRSMGILARSTHQWSLVLVALLLTTLLVACCEFVARSIP